MEVAARIAQVVGEQVQQGWEALTPYARARAQEQRWAALVAELDAVARGPKLDAMIAAAERECALMPDAVRRAPERWWRAAIAGDAEPRLRLVRSLRIIGQHIGDAGVKALVECADLAQLTILRLDGVGMTKLAGDAIAETPYLAKLVELYLHRDQLEDEGVTGVAWRASRMRDLRVLSLVGQGMGDVGAMSLAELDGLRALFLDENDVKSAGMIAIAHARGLRSLERLGLYENRKIGDEGLRALVRRLDEHFPELLDVDASNCGACAALQDELELRLRKRWQS
jgi:hypothetical protein